MLFLTQAFPMARSSSLVKTLPRDFVWKRKYEHRARVEREC